MSPFVEEAANEPGGGVWLEPPHVIDVGGVGDDDLAPLREGGRHLRLPGLRCLELNRTTVGCRLAVVSVLGDAVHLLKRLDQFGAFGGGELVCVVDQHLSVLVDRPVAHPPGAGRSALLLQTFGCAFSDRRAADGSVHRLPSFRIRACLVNR